MRLAEQDGAIVDSRLEQLQDRINRATVLNPVRGTVLTTMVEAGPPDVRSLRMSRKRAGDGMPPDQCTRFRSNAERIKADSLSPRTTAWAPMAMIGGLKEHRFC